ncbi:MAG: thioredoxin domain-containing protein [Phycisphaerae bacterium]
MTPSEAAIPPSSPTSPVRADPPRWRNTLRWIAVATALFGWWISRDLLMLSGGGQASNPILQATCDPTNRSGGFDCLSVLSSKYARIELPTVRDAARDAERGSVGIPWAAAGGGYFLALSYWFAFVGAPRRGRVGWHVLVTLLILCGVYNSAMFMHIMANILHKWCGGCLLAHAANGVLAVAALAMFPWGRGAPATDRHPSPALVGATLFAGLLAVLYLITWTQAWQLRGGAERMKDEYYKIVEDPAFARWHYSQQVAHDLPIRDGEPIEGPADAPNTVVVYADLQCERCKQAHDTLLQVRRENLGRLRVVYRNYPLNSACNRQYKMIVGHPSACAAARALEAAARAGTPEQALEMRALLYANQDDLDRGEYERYARQAGIDSDRFRAALSDPAVEAAIARDVEEATALQVRDVPAVFLNGRRIKFWMNQGTWTALLNPEPTSQSAAGQ